MQTRWQWLLLQLGKRLWLRTSLYALAGIAAALVATPLEFLVPDGLADLVGGDAVDKILGVIASSMLAVTTFSVSVMVTAHVSATSNATPRAASLLIEDSITQQALATFLGTFLFSLAGIIALSTGLYDGAERVILFAVTLLVIGWIVYTLVRWIDHLAVLGKVSETVDQVERVALVALDERLAAPCLNGQRLVSAAPEHYQAIFVDDVGYVQHIDMAGLADCAVAVDSDIYLNCLPGSFIDPSTPLAYVAQDDDLSRKGIGEAITLGRRRSFEQDPRFCLSVLSEIASRALSPGVNDPGTAIDVIGRGVRLLGRYAAEHPAEKVLYERVHVAPLELGDLFDDIYAPIARDGAPMVEVGLRLQKALLALARSGMPALQRHALRLSELAIEHAEQCLQVPQELARLERVRQQLLASADLASGQRAEPREQ